MNIYFITSNRAKLANVKHLCRGEGIDIVPHKKLFYGYGYKEPCIQIREQLLEDSIMSAIERWKRFVRKKDDTFFFIEDTSVKISALSNEQEEVPGVDVKYWMRTITFDQLDALLNEKGNDRSARVMSHLILYIPPIIRQQIGYDKEYKLFTSYTDGHIVTKEYEVQTNILYPWLDNKTFNKWFVPKGEELPMSMLEIEKADQYDFRRGAIEQMLEFLKGYKLIKKESSNPIPQKLFTNRYLFCGETCAGKSTTGRYLLEKYGLYHIEASDFMGVIYHETCGRDTTINKHEFASKLLAAEPTIIAEQVVQYILSNGIEDNFVVTGFRNNAEIDLFTKYFAIADENSFYIDASHETRFERWGLRKRDPNIPYTEDEFLRINKLQNCMGVCAIRERNGMRIIKNNYKKLNTYYKLLDKYTADVDVIFTESIESRINKISKINELSLEACVLLTLAMEYVKNENVYYTTTQIAKRINYLFPYLKKKKNKNNISRYFNVTFYLYYELSHKDGKIEYKLSPLGFSEAIKILEKLEKMNNK